MDVSTGPLSEETIRDRLSELSAKEEEVEKELVSLVSQQLHLDAKVSNIAKALPNLEMVYCDSKKLSEMISFTSQLAENISAKVRKLDTARSRVSECQQRVHDLLDLQLCSVGVETSLTSEDFEKAAAHIHRYLSMDQRLLEKTADDMQQDFTTVSNSLSFLHSAAEKLCKVIAGKFEEAIKNDDAASVERFFKLFPLLHMHSEALETYSRFLCKKINYTAKKSLQNAINISSSDKRVSVIFADTVTKLFEDVAEVIETQQPIVETYYGPGMLEKVVEVVQQECDDEVALMLSEMSRVRGLERLRSQVRTPVAPTTRPQPARTDPRQLDLLLAEITTIHNRYSLYSKFICRKLSDEVGEKLIRKSKLSSEMHDLLTTYLLLEHFYMSESVKKAIIMDTVDPNSLVSSMIDDVFFIVKKCIRRATGTGSIDGVCAVINHGCGVLETELCGALERSMRQGFPSAYLDLTQAYNVMIQGKAPADTHDQAKTMFIKHLNNTEVCGEYVGTLAEGLAMEIPVRSEAERAKLNGCLSGLGGVTAVLGAARDLGLQQLRHAAIKPRIAPWIDYFNTLSHHLTEEEFSNYEANEPFTRSLVGHLDGLLSEFNSCLTPQNYDAVVSIVASEVSIHLEKAIMKTEFNRFGGLALDKEVRCIISYLSGATGWSVRDKLARLSQVTTVLNLERVSEMSDYWNQSALTWRLTPPDIRNIMKLRSDFRTEDIMRLKL